MVKAGCYANIQRWGTSFLWWRWVFKVGILGVGISVLVFAPVLALSSEPTREHFNEESASLSDALVSNTAAGSAPVSDLFSLSLEQLLDVKVVSASKSGHRLIDAPGTITAYSQTRIKQLGYYSLKELANITPGYSAYNNIGETSFETRGQMASGFDNNRHLVLVDGIPVNHVRANSAPSDEQLPLYFAEQVEFLRGPASALYGLSAFYGVINIQPQQSGQRRGLELNDEDGWQTQGRASRASMDAETQILTNSFYLSESSSAGVHVGYYGKQASASSVAEGEPEYKNYDDQQSVFLYANWQATQGAIQGLKLGTLYMEKDSGLGNFWSGSYSSEKNTIEWKTWVLYGKYQRQVAQNLRLDSYLKYNYSSEAATYYDATESQKSQYDYPFHSYEFQAELAWNLRSNQQIIAGVNIDPRYGDAAETQVANEPSFTPRTPTVTSRSAFFQYQAELPVLKGMLLTVGARQDESRAGNEHYSQLSPRLAVVQKLGQHFNIKMLYGEALRGPSVKEIGVNTEVANENPAVVLDTLLPETIDTFEIAPYFQNDSMLASLTFFRNHSENTLVRNWSSLGEYTNVADAITSEGFELELNYRLPTILSQALYANTEFSLLANYSYAWSQNTEGYSQSDIPRRKANIGLLFERAGGKGAHGAIMARWLDCYTSMEAHSDGYAVLDFNFNLPLRGSFELGLHLTNLLDEQYYGSVGGQPALEMPGRAATISLSYR